MAFKCHEVQPWHGYTKLYIVGVNPELGIVHAYLQLAPASMQPFLGSHAARSTRAHMSGSDAGIH